MGESSRTVRRSVRIMFFNRMTLLASAIVIFLPCHIFRAADVPLGAVQEQFPIRALFHDLRPIGDLPVRAGQLALQRVKAHDFLNGVEPKVNQDEKEVQFRWDWTRARAAGAGLVSLRCRSGLNPGILLESNR